MNKAAIRSKILHQRKNLGVDFIYSHSNDVIKHLTTSTLFMEATNIALYLPINGEIDLTALLRIPTKNFYIPAINGKQMQFHLYHHQLNLITHRFGVKQPDFIDSYNQPQLDLCLMPLVAFDQQGNRLGMGGGFYDRYFSNNTSTILAGVAYQFQQVEQLPVDSWDVKLHHFFSEQGHFAS